MKTKTKRILLGAATVAAVAVAGGLSQEAQAATQAIQMTAKIIAPIAISQVSSLKFATLTVAAATAGTAKMTTAGVRSATAGVSLIGGAAAGQQGKFKITAGANIAYTVTAPTKASVTQTGAGTAKMTVNAFRMGATATKLASQTHAGSAATYPLGGTLNVGAAQAPGSYVGAVTLTAVYK